MDQTGSILICWLPWLLMTLWVVHMEVDLVSCSVTIIMTNVFSKKKKKKKKNLLTNFAKIMSAADTCD
jgi:hypothetical protein